MADGASPGVDGQQLDDGGVRLKGEDDGEWIQAEYRDGWVGRKLMNPRDPDAYDEMVKPYLYQCTWCREWQSTVRWGAGCNLCPNCEHKRHYVVGEWFEATNDGELPTPTETCPKCGSENIEIGVLVDYDSVCHDCEHGWNNRVTAQEDNAQ